MMKVGRLLDESAVNWSSRGSRKNTVPQIVRSNYREVAKMCDSALS